jgi:hypothetical protein
MLTPADIRVLAFLRSRQAGVAAIGRACFQAPGKPARSGIRPAAAHLARMRQRGLVRVSGGLYSPAPESSPDLFS